MSERAKSIRPAGRLGTKAEEKGAGEGEETFAPRQAGVSHPRPLLVLVVLTGFPPLGAKVRIGVGGRGAGALAFLLDARRMMGRGPGRAGAPSFFLGARARAGMGNKASGSLFHFYPNQIL